MADVAVAEPPISAGIPPYEPHEMQDLAPCIDLFQFDIRHGLCFGELNPKLYDPFPFFHLETPFGPMTRIALLEAPRPVLRPLFSPGVHQTA